MVYVYMSKSWFIVWALCVVFVYMSKGWLMVWALYMCIFHCFNNWFVSGWSSLLSKYQLFFSSTVTIRTGTCTCMFTSVVVNNIILSEVRLASGILPINLHTQVTSDMSSQMPRLRFSWWKFRCGSIRKYQYNCLNVMI